ncbi:MAG: SDR family oxidoreductase [Bacteroidota bacterium]|nr:SDR family oxidoreductase [Bacteroidota bacterium]
MQNKTVLITGATSGIGKVTAKELAKLGAHIILLARNKSKATQTKTELIAECGHNNVDVFIADLSSLQDVRNVAREINSKYEKIDVLINNAGLILGSKREESADGNELTLATNHLGPFLLTALLFDLLLKSEEARILNLSSEAYKIAKPDFENIELKTGYSAIKAYANTKFYNLLFTKELDRRIKKRNLNIVTNAIHPGVVSTGFGKASGGLTGFIFKAFQLFLTSPEKGAETSIHLASSRDEKKISGNYFKNKKITKTNDKIVNEVNAKKLWQISEALTGTKFL